MNYSLCSMPLMSGLMVVLLTIILHGEYGFSSVGNSAILGNESRIQGQNYFALLQGSKMTVGFHYRNWVEHSSVV